MYDGYAINAGLQAISDSLFAGASSEESLRAFTTLIVTHDASEIGSSKKLIRLVERRIQSMDASANVSGFIDELKTRARIASARQAVLVLVTTNHGTPATR